MKICSKFTGEHHAKVQFQKKLLCNFIEIALQHGCSPVNLLHIFRTTFLKGTSEGLLLDVVVIWWEMYATHFKRYFNNLSKFKV